MIQTNRSRTSVSVLSSVPISQAIAHLAAQIPCFKGSEEDNVELWIHQVENVARIHGVSDDIILLAILQKLKKLALDWFEMKSGYVNDSWQNFKEALVKKFERKIPCRQAIQRVEARK